MMKTKLEARTSALPAIAAALALSSTPVWAQAAQPVPTDPLPVTSSQPAPTVPDPTPAQPDASPSTDSIATPAVETTTAKTVTTTKSKRTLAARTTPVATTTTKRTVTTRPAAPAVASARKTTTVTTTKPVAINSRPQPVVDLNAKPTTPAMTTATAKPAHKKNDALPIAAGGALAFLALGGAAVAMNRRRDDEDEWVEEQPVDTTVAETRHDPIVHDAQPAIIAPAAFTWDRSATAANGESHVEQAYGGPTPGNPSLSLRKRLKRAAFMDKREREAAAGLAVPVEATAGLPDRMVSKDRREHERA